MLCRVSLDMEEHSIVLVRPGEALAAPYSAALPDTARRGSTLGSDLVLLGDHEIGFVLNHRGDSGVWLRLD